MTSQIQARPAAGFEELRPLLRRLTGDEKHEPSAHSTLDVLWVLYDRVLRVDPSRPDAEDRDRFLVSKGHGPHAYYAVLALKGFFPVDWLDDLAGPGSQLGHHPDRTLVPGVEIGSGSLGHGLGLGVGVALGLRALSAGAKPEALSAGAKPEALSAGAKPEALSAGAKPEAQGVAPRVYVLLGDGELDEGSNHEAIAYAGMARLDSLTAIVVDNHSASWRQDLASLFTGHGWSATTVDGRDHDAIEAVVRGHRAGRPHVVVAEV